MLYRKILLLKEAKAEFTQSFADEELSNTYRKLGVSECCLEKGLAAHYEWAPGPFSASLEG